MDLNYAEGWRPEEGDTLLGRVTDLSMGASTYGRYPIVTVAPEDGGDAVAVHAFHTGLKNRLAELRPKVGERIGIKYLGKRPLKSNPANTVAVYIVKMDRGADVWAEVGARVEVPASDVPIDASDFEPQGSPKADEDDIPF